jgi:hypothetical protein
VHLSPHILQAAKFLNEPTEPDADGGRVTSNAAEVGRPTGLSEKALVSLAATSGMLLLLCAYWTLEPGQQHFDGAVTLGHDTDQHVIPKIDWPP